MTRVVIDASAGAEIVTATARGRALARLIPGDAELWVPEHFYVEVLGVLRHQSVVTHIISPDRAELAIDRLRRWHLRQAAIAPRCFQHGHVATTCRPPTPCMWRSPSNSALPCSPTITG